MMPLCFICFSLCFAINLMVCIAVIVSCMIFQCVFLSRCIKIVLAWRICS